MIENVTLAIVIPLYLFFFVFYTLAWGDKLIAHRCPDLQDDRLCRIWSSPQDRGPLCWWWPVSPANLLPFPSCGLSFERRDP